MSFIKLARRFFEHDIWMEPREFSKAEAWLDLIQSARWSDGTQMIGNKIIRVKRGQLIASHRYLQERWGWKSLTKIQNYLSLLQNEVMIEVEKKSKISIITICKYDVYNNSEDFLKSEKSQSEVNKKSIGSQSEVKEEEYKERKERKEDYVGESAAENSDWIEALKADDLFREQVAMKHRIFGDDFDRLLADFTGTKKALGELNHKSFSDFRRNFLYWIPKNLNAAKNDNSTGKTRNHANLIDEETARRVFARVTEKDR